ncbi:SDR family NAD(P)-dependent oxidoreductase [Confluentibacter sediminis]|uniref:SDR family NAD(P)-dependent oxidoreductase n=1 Tax=Confluentibacter sediminis TaxID=2219045 RepID=UPI001F32696D|nr:SDR family NAD(P)-dependent oxidoreductase [Confluentibacter sediminis]
MNDESLTTKGKEMKRAIVVGATSGIGKGMARLLTENHFKVGITGRRIELLNELKSEKNNSYLIKSFDITDTLNVARHLEELTSELGGLDLLLLSSGTGDENENLDFKTEKRIIDINVIGFTIIADWVFNYFQKQKYGHLVAISSIAGLRGSRQASAYNATKAYQINYLEGLRQKATKLKTQIYVTDVRPGFVDTEMAKADKKFWVATVDKASLQIYSSIKQKKKIVYITRRWRLMAILLKVLPRHVYDRV